MDDCFDELHKKKVALKCRTEGNLRRQVVVSVANGSPEWRLQAFKALPQCLCNALGGRHAALLQQVVLLDLLVPLCWGSIAQQKIGNDPALSHL